MNDMLYHTATPEATQTTYIEYNNVDFVLNVGAGRSLMRNTVRINGDIQITNDGTATSTGTVYLDFRIGAHGVIESCQTVFGGQGGGIKENIQNYARWCEMGAVGTLYEDDYLNASNQCELRSPNENCSALLAQGEVTDGNGGAALSTDLDFSIKPNCILNKMNGDHLPFEKTGEIRLTINLARNMSALMGRSQGAAATYILKNLHCSYHSLPTVGKWSDTRTTMRSVYNVKSTILSGSANVSAQVPAVCDAVSCSFQRQNRENQNVFNNYQLETVENIRRVQFLFNDSTNKYVSYVINDQNEMLHRYIDSFNDTGHNQVSGDCFRTNAGFGIGLSFQGFVDLSKQRFAVQLDSDVNNTKPMNIYLYFHSLISV
tara:strand:+ start:2458 stop:3579 length:1122 start_codon:yes stop_codon:yes gene_type:complete